MDKKYYSKTVSLKETLDNYLLKKLNTNGWCSYSDLLESFLKDLNIYVCSSSSKKGKYAVYGDNYAYTTVLYFTSFYIPELISLNYISLYKIASDENTEKEEESEISLGSKEVEQMNPGYLPTEVSSEIKQNLSHNIVISPEFKEFVEAGHQSLELCEAKKATKLALWAVVLSAISIIAAIIIA